MNLDNIIMEINASLAGHILNPAGLSGTRLEGHLLVDTAEYMANSKVFTSPEHVRFIQKLKYLVQIEKQIYSYSNPETIDAHTAIIANNIVKDVLSLAQGDWLFIPGGWYNLKDGHSMIYKFVHKGDTIDFFAYNSGLGYRKYHEKASGTHEELYNPAKIWRFPFPTTKQKINELAYFIDRLIKARIPEANVDQIGMSAQKLYEELLSSISYVDGLEKDASSQIPKFGYSTPQLSRTCSYSVLELILKIHSSSLQEYQQSIFEFKMDALEDYTQACFGGRQPLNAAVAEQIHLAIENNLKILNEGPLFNEKRTESYLQQLIALKEQLNATKFSAESNATASTAYPACTLVRTALKSHRSISSRFEYSTPNESRILFTSDTLLAELERHTSNIKATKNYALQYSYVEKLLLALPLSTSGALNFIPYSNLHSIDDYQAFYKHIRELQEIIYELQKVWLNKTQITKVNTLALSALTLQTDVYNILNEKKDLPSFKSFTDLSLQAILGNHKRNPFLATNNPKLDARFHQLQQRYSHQKAIRVDNHRHYFNHLLNTNLPLREELENVYYTKFGACTEEVHVALRKEKLHALYLISLHCTQAKKALLNARFNPLIDKVKAHLQYEAHLRRSINPFFTIEYPEQPFINFELNKGVFRVDTPLYPTYIPKETLSKDITLHKYALEPSPAKNALEIDVPEQSAYTKAIIARTANRIQLTPDTNHQDTSRSITQSDILGRDYYHLRSNPEVQIALTMDYFERNITMLATASNRTYVEANLFQPGLLLNIQSDSFPSSLVDETKIKAVLTQFDGFIKTGLRFYSSNGQHTLESLFFLRLNYLISNYFALAGTVEAITRLTTIQTEITAQLINTTEPHIRYVLQHYLFLTTMGKIDAQNYTSEDFEIALRTYFYIQSHQPSVSFQDTSDETNLSCAIARFQTLIHQEQQKKPIEFQSLIEQLVTSMNEASKTLRLSGCFPTYDFVNSNKTIIYQFNVILGKLFKEQLALSGVPLSIKDHPLIKHVQLDEETTCLISATGQYLYFPHSVKKAKAYYEDKQLTIQQQWSIDTTNKYYELLPLTEKHLAYKSNNNLKKVETSKLPEILIDGSMNFWRRIDTPNEGILVQNNVPKYKLSHHEVVLLDDNGHSTPFTLNALQDPWASQIASFENPQFIAYHKSSDAAYVELPRFGLRFSLKANKLKCLETDEEIMACPPPIPNVAGIVLSKNSNKRYIVPIARFYATTNPATASDVYPVVHDKDDIIKTRELERDLRYKHYSPLWHHQGSKRYVSFCLNDDNPEIDTVADGLYLAYIYLAANKPQKAWGILEDCRTRLGGLIGSPEELMYISWIYSDIPYILPGEEGSTNSAVRKTPPYVACKLKALSMLCDYLSRDHHFELPTPAGDEDQANTHWARLEHEQIVAFLKTLPKNIYSTFTRFQSMRRHLEDTYNLSPTERKRLLDHYHQSRNSDEPPVGALGHEWMQLNLEIIKKEQATLLAFQQSGTLSTTDQRRLLQIQSHLATLKPVLAHSSVLQSKPINLHIPTNVTIRTGHLTKVDQELLDTWRRSLPGATCSEAALDAALSALSSIISERDLVIYFPSLLQIAIGSNEERKKALMDFCVKTLIAERHIPLQNQTKNRKLLCNILYRAGYNSDAITSLGYDYNFDTLLTWSTCCTVPELFVDELVDVYEQILATPTAILEQQKTHVRMAVNPLRSNYRPLSNNVTKESSLNTLLEDYYKVQIKYDETHQALTKELTADLEKTYRIEEQVGNNQLELEKQHIKLANRLLTDGNSLKLMSQILMAETPKISSIIEDTWQEALTLANEGPAESRLALSWKIDRVSKKRSSLKKTNLYNLYTQKDLSYTAEKTGLSIEKAQTLHQLIHQALEYGIQLKMITQIQNSIKKATLSGNAQDLVYGLELFALQEIPALETPSTVLLQHEEDRIAVLRPPQVNALKTLLNRPSTGKSFKEVIAKIMQGNGKSKVLLPIVDEEKADGTNFVIVIVPYALLATDHVDLNRISQRLFGKSAYRFEFNRDSNSSSIQLEQIYNRFIEIKNSRGYLVTASESIQSLELKYIELLLTEERDQNKEWEQQIYWCDAIINLIHDYGAAFIDEAHHSLWLKKKLNYTVGTPKPLSQQTIKNASVLFQYIGADFIKKAPSLDDNYDWTPFKKNLATKLLTETNSPIHSFVTDAKKSYGDKVLDELLNYLINADEAVLPEAILLASKEIKTSFGFFKEQISVLLPQTLVRRVDEKYGASKKANLSAIERTSAIPYSANITPNEGSLFANPLVAINYTCQMLFLKGVSKELLIEKIALWQAIARQELFKDASLSDIDNTPIAHGIKLKWPALSDALSQIKLNDEEQIRRIHDLLKDDPDLILEILEQQSLKLIHQDSEIIHSDSFNHVDMYNTTQAVSGTPNHTTLHQRLKYDNSSSLGSDGYIIGLVNQKDTPLTFVDYKDATQFINHIFSHGKSSRNCRAIIDIRAAFQGISNLAVAQELASYSNSHQTKFSKPIKHVLYFNEEQVLCAIDVNKPGAAIRLKTSDVNEINRLLGSTPEERITYYDQVRTLGTDITQYDEAHALVLVDEKTSLQAFTQGIMRMRGFRQKQTIELVAPEKLKTLSRTDLIKKFSKTDEKTLLADNFFAATGQMSNLIRRTCLDKIRTTPAQESRTKAKLTTAFKCFFVHTPNQDYFESYGALSKKQPTKVLFNDYKEKLLTHWQKAYTKADLTLTAEDITSITEQLDTIIATALPYCAKEYEHITGNTVGTEVEVQKEVLSQTQVQVATINESFNPELQALEPVVWDVDLHRLFKQPVSLEHLSIEINNITSPSLDKPKLFSPKLRLSKNYAYCHTTQKQVLDAFLKPASVIWYHIEDDDLHAMILTPEELPAIKAHIAAHPNNNWISTTRDTVLYGVRPNTILEDEQYLSLREQVRFFNGEVNSLLNPEAPLCWLNKNTTEKLNFLEYSILPYRPHDAAKFAELRTALDPTNQEGFLYIKEEAINDEIMVHYLSNTKLNAEHLRLLLESEPIGNRLLNFIYTHEEANAQVREKACQHSSFSSINVSNLLDNQSITAPSVLYLLQTPNNIIEACFLPKILAQFHQHPQVLCLISAHQCATDMDLLNQLVAKAFKLYERTKNEADKHILEECLINTFKKLHAQTDTKNISALIQKHSKVIRSKLGLTLLELFGTSQPHLQSKEIIDSTFTKGSLDQLIQIKDLTASELEQIAKKELSTKQIHSLLERDDMTSHMGNILFAKKNYDYIIKNWPWLNHKHLITILNTSKDQTSIDNAINHKNLTSHERAQWLDGLMQKQSQMQKTALASQDPAALLDAALEKLRIKVFSHMIQASTKKQYKEAAQTAFELHKKLEAHKTALIAKSQTTISACLKEINRSQSVFAEQRGFKKIILDILNVLLMVVTLGVQTLKGYNWRFFNTDSTNVVNELYDCIKQFSSKQQITDSSRLSFAASSRTNASTESAPVMVQT